MEVLLPLINSPQAIFPIKSISGNEEQDKSHSLTLLLSIKSYSLVTIVRHGVFHSQHTPLIVYGASQFQYIIHDIPLTRPKASFHLHKIKIPKLRSMQMGKKLFMHLRVLGFHLLSSLHEAVI